MRNDQTEQPDLVLKEHLHLYFLDMEDVFLGKMTPQIVSTLGIQSLYIHLWQGQQDTKRPDDPAWPNPQGPLVRDGHGGRVRAQENAPDPHPARPGAQTASQPRRLYTDSWLGQRSSGPGTLQWIDYLEYFT